jgi:hypothetical protein
MQVLASIQIKSLALVQVQLLVRHLPPLDDVHAAVTGLSFDVAAHQDG